MNWYPCIQSEDNSDYISERREKYLKECSDELNKNVPKRIRCNIKDANLYQGFFTSDEWGSYKIEFTDNNGDIILSCILDIILGEMVYNF